MKKLIAIFFISLFSFVAANSQVPDWAEIEEIFDRKGAVQAEVFKIAFPRADLQVKVDDIAIDPALALTSWIAFRKTESHTMIMGDLVLLDREVALVMAKMITSGIEITALRNHMLFESPRLFFLHFWGFDAPEKLAAGLKAALDKTQRAQPIR